ncbi:hypothetical protein C8R47DRAFT_1205387 [Mycena vitilis]|nr:hypothetical protein C8R47DRAFT_1205387 [Mycena vitilis]
MSTPGPLDLVRYRARRWPEELALREEEDRRIILFFRNLLPKKLSPPLSTVSHYKGDLQVGERYQNMDYLFCRACMNSAIAYDTLIIYDYSCPLAVDANFRIKSREAQSQPNVYPPEFYDDVPALEAVSDDDDDEAPLPFRHLRAKL